MGDIAAYLNKYEIKIENTKLTDDKFIDVVNYLNSQKINSKVFKTILDDIMEEDLSIDEILEKSGFKEINNEELVDIIKEVLKNNEQSVNDYHAGNIRSIKYIMGQIMKETKGNANPKEINSILEDLLNK